MTKRKQTVEQAEAAERNFAKGRHMRRAQAEARQAAAAAQAAKSPERVEWEARYEAARQAYNANPCFETYQPMEEMRRESQEAGW